MTYEAYLIRRATGYWSTGDRLPIVLFAEMLAAGLDVSEIETQYMEQYDDE
jgi:hypothetical protein